MSMNLHTINLLNQQAKTQKSKKSLSSQQIRRKLSAIRSKVYRGGRLTAADKQFLKKYAPELYTQLVAIEQERERIEQDKKRREFREKMEELENRELEKIAEDQNKEKEEIWLTYSKKVKEETLQEELEEELEKEAAEEEKHEADLTKKKEDQAFVFGKSAYQAVLKTEEPPNQCCRKA